MVYVKIRNSPYECLRQMSKFDHQETIENEEEEEEGNIKIVKLWRRE